MNIENVMGLVALVGVGIVVGLAYRKWKESKSTPVREPIILTPTPLPKSIAPKKKAPPVAKYANKAVKKAPAKKAVKKPAAKRK
jgi:hypothetical protein